MIRAFQVLVVAFWLATTGWLFRAVFWPGESSFDPVSPLEPLKAFFEWNDTNSLILTEHGERMGEMAVSGFSEFDKELGHVVCGFSMSGSMDPPERGPVTGVSGMSWKLTTQFDEALAPMLTHAAARVPSQGLSARIEIEGEPASLTASLSRGGVPLFEVKEVPLTGKEARATEDAASALLPKGAAAAGLPPLLGDAAGWKPDFEAGRGLVEISGRRLPVYRLLARFGGDEPERRLEILFSEAGEPLRVTSGLGYEAIAEVLAPVEMLATYSPGRPNRKGDAPPPPQAETP
ncbi:MAG: hypothetical protein KDM91_11615 [Verrucomicrobiae bacterium]|nr:hypothetical protein [Verrucomicrobiae bacterium]MCP5539730.1 hypothetical protein [Akkermansiaceae bacterium]MCP5549467.1 hypothetical protein [Akkermansiaceae bacterium]